MGPGSDDVTDEMLMLRYQRGDRDAFALLVRRYKVRVFNFVLRRVKEANAADDLAQDVFLRVVQKAGDFKHEARFSTWLYTIARNLSIDHLRKMSLRRHASLDQPSKNSGPDLVETLSDQHPRGDVERTAAATRVQQCIISAVDALPEDQREVFLLREVANLPFKDIAEITGVGENTAKSRMRYALDRLQAALCDFEEYARALR